MNSSSSNPEQNTTNNNRHHPNLLQEKKSTGGRKKLPMEKIKSETSRQVTFSKRRGSLVKKASELGTLTGTEIALVVFSPGGKAYSYGNPSVERVTSRWMYANAYTHDERAPGSAMRAATLSSQNEAIAKIEAKVGAQRNCRGELTSAKAAAQLSGTYPHDLETLRYDELCALKASVLGFKRSFDAKVHEAKDIVAAEKLLEAPQQRSQRFSNVIGSSSSSHEVFNVNIVNSKVNPSDQTMRTGVFNPGGFASYNPSSLRYGGSSSFAFPSSCNAGQLESGSAMNDIKVPDGGFTCCDPKELLFDDMRFLSHVPDLVTTASTAFDGDDANVLPEKDVAEEEKCVALGNDGQSEGNRIGDDFMEELLWNYGGGY